jgi:hypothetical protein
MPTVLPQRLKLQQAMEMCVDLEEVWRIREEEVYPKLFGSVSRGIFPLTQELFSRRFGQQDVDPR